MPPGELEPTISAGERSQTDALYRLTTGTVSLFWWPSEYRDTNSSEGEVKESVAVGMKAYYTNLKFFKSRFEIKII